MSDQLLVMENLSHRSDSTDIPSRDVEMSLVKEDEEDTGN